MGGTRRRKTSTGKIADAERVREREENSRQHEEALRRNAEGGRRHTEELRCTAEKARAHVEAARKQAERSREEAELARVHAETAREAAMEVLVAKREQAEILREMRADAAARKKASRRK